MQEKDCAVIHATTGACYDCSSLLTLPLPRFEAKATTGHRLCDRTSPMLCPAPCKPAKRGVHASTTELHPGARGIQRLSKRLQEYRKERQSPGERRWCSFFTSFMVDLREHEAIHDRTKHTAARFRLPLDPQSGSTDAMQPVAAVASPALCSLLC